MFRFFAKCCAPTLLGAFAALCFAALPGRAQEPEAEPAAQVYDLRVATVPGSLRAAELRIDSSMDRKEGPAQLPERRVSKAEVILADEVLELDSETGFWVIDRTFVRAQSEMDGKVRDDPVNGMRVRYSVGENGLAYEILGESWLTDEYVDELIWGHHQTLGFYMELPAAASIGQELTVDLRPMLRLVFGITEKEAIEGGVGELSLTGVDEAGVARLKGRTTVVVPHSEDGVEGDMRMDVEVVIEFDSQAKELLLLALEGRLGMSITKPMRASYEGPVEVEMKFSSGSRAKSLARRKPEYRPRVHELEGGLEVELPSDWIEVRVESSEEGMWNFKSTLLPSDTGPLLEAKVYAAGGDFDEAMDTFEDSLRTMAQGLKSTSTSTSLGRAKTFTYHTDELFFRMDVVPLKNNRLLRVRTLAGTEKELDHIEPVIKKALKSLRAP